jgi:hypothetical protein
VNYHEDISRWLESIARSRGEYYSLNAVGASDLLDEWEDAQAMIRALEDLVCQLQREEPPAPAWMVIA